MKIDISPCPYQFFNNAISLHAVVSGVRCRSVISKLTTDALEQYLYVPIDTQLLSAFCIFFKFNILIISLSALLFIPNTMKS